MGGHPLGLRRRPRGVGAYDVPDGSHPPRTDRGQPSLGYVPSGRRGPGLGGRRGRRRAACIPGVTGRVDREVAASSMSSSAAGAPVNWTSRTSGPSVRSCLSTSRPGATMPKPTSRPRTWHETWTTQASTRGGYPMRDIRVGRGQVAGRRYPQLQASGPLVEGPLIIVATSWPTPSSARTALPCRASAASP